MTAPKSTTRPRRRTSAENLPRVLVEWFEGKPRRADQSSAPWLAMAFPGYVLLPEWWKIWRTAHPDARPPSGYGWMDDTTSPRHPPAWMLEQARKCSRRAQ